MLVARLAKLAAISAAIRKQAGALKAVGKAAVGLGGMVVKRPIAAASVGLGASSGIAASRKYRPGFNPEVHKAMLGQPPVPPGSE